MRRARGSGGRFAKKPDVDASKRTAEGKVNFSGPAPSQSGSSSGSEPLPSDSIETWNSSNGEPEARVHQAHSYMRGDSHYHTYSGLQTSTYGSYPGEKGDNGDCSSGQQRGSISSNQASQRPLAIL